MAMMHLQRAGHRPIVLVGGGTTMVGDPSGKTEMRQMLSEADIRANGARLHAQLDRYLHASEGKAIAVDNADWLLPLNYIAFLREIGVHFSVNRMLAAEAYKQRLERGLSFIEFNYQLLQAYDYLTLYRQHGCTLQMGGDDQWGNILAGVDLIRRVEGATVHAMTFPLLTTASGAKMGKTAGGAVWLDADLLSPYDYYQYWVNCDDRDVERFPQNVHLFAAGRDRTSWPRSRARTSARPSRSWPTRRRGSRTDKRPPTRHRPPLKPPLARPPLAARETWTGFPPRRSPANAWPPASP